MIDNCSPIRSGFKMMYLRNCLNIIFDEHEASTDLFPVFLVRVINKNLYYTVG